MHRADGYGYEVVRRLRVAGLAEIGDASVYGTLRRLYTAGALSTYVVPSDDGPHRKYYSITPSGRELLERQRADELDDLLDGMHADLADRLADGDDLGDPSAYADELRSAAGLPPRRPETPEDGRRGLAEALRHGWADAAARGREFWAATPARRGARDFVVSLRPVWWVARGVAIAGVVLYLLGRFSYSFSLVMPQADPITVVVVLASIVLSVQWGGGASGRPGNGWLG